MILFTLTNKQARKGGLILALALSVALLVSVSRMDTREPESVSVEPETIAPTVTPTPTNIPSPTPTSIPAWIEGAERGYQESQENIEGFTSYFLELEPLGKYFITAYSPQETGSWTTASGIKLHRAKYEDRYTSPTTCAVDPKLHKIGKNGTKFYIEEFDRVFIAQDTGALIKGRKLDLAYTDLKSVKKFPTGKYQTYKVISVTKSTYSKDDVEEFYTW